MKLRLHIVNEKDEPKELSKQQLRILHEESTDKPLTREQISQHIETLGTIKRDLTVLRDEGFLNRTGGNTYGNWVILKCFN